MKIEYTIDGTPNSPVLIFSNSLGAKYMMWDGLIPYLKPYFKIIRYNTDPLLAKLNASIDDLAFQVIELMNHLEIEKASFCGLSMGGLIGQSLAINHKHRFHKIILANTAAKIGSDATWNERINLVRDKGFEDLSQAMMLRWFTDGFRVSNQSTVDLIQSEFKNNDIQKYIKNCEAIRDCNFTPHLALIDLPILVTTGDQDEVTNSTQSQFLKENIKNAELKIVSAKHLSATELPQTFSEMIIDFIIGNTIYKRGMHIRRSVLGHSHVDRANDSINDFNSDFQNFITQAAWGEVWSRPGLDKQQRSHITIAMLIALNRKAELIMHLKAAINNGVSTDEIKEIILHAAIYCGVPAANEAMHAAQEIITDLDLKI